MFSKLMANVEFSDVESFCDQRKEGIRVEYKSEMPNNLPKTISSFANTQGGVLVLGVETDENNRAVLPIKGMEKQRGIEETITSSSLQGIYPAVFPEVKIIDVPNTNDKIVVVVKVHESVEVPHAIQNSTRVYIRTGSQSQPYELAEIDRIEYMLKRRQKPEERKQRLLSAAQTRFRLHRGPQPQLGPPNPTFEVAISVLFPYQPLMSLELLNQFMRQIPPDDPVRYVADDARRVNEGFCKVFTGYGYFQYFDINQYGFIFRKGNLLKVKSNSAIASPDDKDSYVSFAGLVTDIGEPLHLAELFFAKCVYEGNIEARLTIENIFQQKLHFDDSYSSGIAWQASDNRAYASDTQLVGETETRIIANLMKNVLWVFNFSVEESSIIESKVRKVLLKKNLIAG